MEFLVLAGLPLLLYPVVLFGATFFVLAPANADNRLAEIVGTAFLYTSLLYPIGYAVAGVIYFAWSRPAGAAVAVAHLAACVVLLAAWWMVSGGK